MNTGKTIISFLNSITKNSVRIHNSQRKSWRKLRLKTKKTKHVLNPGNNVIN
jgi:hypothetical protein